MHASTVPLGRRGFADRDVARHHGNAGPGDDQPDGRGVGLWDAALPRLPAWHRRRNRGGAARGRDGDHGGPPRRPGGADGAAADAIAKVLILTIMIIVINTAWLAAGTSLAPLLRDPGRARLVNRCLAAVLLAAAALTVLGR